MELILGACRIRYSATSNIVSSYAAYPRVNGSQTTGSNSANPALRGILYRTQLPAGQRITQDGMPTSNIPRMYHSSAALTGKG